MSSNNSPNKQKINFWSPRVAFFSNQTKDACTSIFIECAIDCVNVVFLWIWVKIAYTKEIKIDPKKVTQFKGSQ